MVDYASFLYNAFAGPGQAFADGRQEKRANMQDDRNYAAQMEKFGWQKDTDQRDFNYRGERDQVGDGQWSQEFGANQSYRNRSLGLQERGMDRNAFESDRSFELAKRASERKDIQPLVNAKNGIYDPNSGSWVPPPQGPNGAAPVGNFDDEAKLRAEYLKGSGDYMSVRDSFGRLQAATKDQTGASDIAAVYSFMKMLDPGSVVREGEFATAEQAGGLPDRVVSLYNKVVNGERLSPDVRRQFLDQAGQQFRSAQDRQTKYGETYKGLSTQYGFDPTRITPDLSAGVQAPEMPAPGGQDWNDVGGGIKMRQTR